MTDLKHWQEIIQERRKKTNFRDFIVEIWSWFPVVFHKYDSTLSRHPISDRIGWITNYQEFEDTRSDLLKIWRDYDFDRSFEENFKRLMQDATLPNLAQFWNNENTEYGDVILWSKNVYLSILVVESENVMYSNGVFRSKNVYRSLTVDSGSENIYHSKAISSSQNTFYSRYIKSWYELWFCSECVWCRECIFCQELENAEYCIGNKQLSREEYQKQKEEILVQVEKYQDWYKWLKKTGKDIGCKNTSGSYNLFCENIENGYGWRNVKNARNIIDAGWDDGNIYEELYDAVSTGGYSLNDIYGVQWVSWGSHLYCSSEITDSSNIYYSYYLEGCNHMFACIGLKNTSYCILNKQYSKEEWQKIVDNIFKAMQDDWILGEMIPPSINPFNFNDTFSWVIGILDRKGAIDKWYLWREQAIKTWVPDDTWIVKVSDLDLQNYDKDICEKVIESEDGNFYRIMPIEYEFLKKHNLPLPDIHWKETMKLQLQV